MFFIFSFLKKQLCLREINGNIQSYRYFLTEVFIQVAIPMKVATISRKRNLMKFTKYSYTFKTAKIANKNYKYITNIIANKLQKEYSHTPFSLCNSKIFNYRYICNYFHREKNITQFILRKLLTPNCTLITIIPAIRSC